jgi:two-component system nitrogen regulation response regulator GlnG
MKRRVIVLEDDESLRLVITKALSRAGFEVRATASPDTAIERMARQEADALVADVLLGRENFLERLSEVTQVRPNAPVIVMSAQTTVATALGANKGGAYEYLPKPFDINDLTDLLTRALEGEGGRSTAKHAAAGERLIGRSPAMQDAFRAMARLAQSKAPVLITGPDGTGRATAGRLIHLQGGVSGPLVEAGPQEFASQTADLWESAQGGSLLLRRAEDWTPTSQAFIREKLEQENAPGPRLIVTAADTISDHLGPALLHLIGIGRVALPPLHQRGEDRALLFEAFLEAADPSFKLTAAGAAYVNAHAWPGEVLQLKRTAEHIAAQGARGPVGPESIAEALSGRGNRNPDDELETAAIRYFAALNDTQGDNLAARAQLQLERGLVRAALEASGGVRQVAARRLGMNRNTFARKIDQLGLMDED